MKTATSRAYMLLNQLVIGLLLATVPLAPELVQGQEGRLRDLIDREIKEVRRTAASAPTLEEKLSWQKQQREFLCLCAASPLELKM